MLDGGTVRLPKLIGLSRCLSGMPLLDGGTVRLPKLIGLSRAMGLILRGEGVTGKEAFEMGLVDRLVKTGSGDGSTS